MALIELDISALEERIEELAEAHNSVVTSDQLREYVEQEIDNRALVSSGEVSDAIADFDFDGTIGDYLSNNDYVTRYDIDEAVDEKMADYEPSADQLRVAVGDLLDPLKNSLIDLRTAGGSYEDRLKTLEDKLVTQQELLDEFLNESRAARTFFDLLKQAFALLRN